MNYSTALYVPVEHGIPMKTVQAILGHASYTITASIYGHVTHDMHEEAANAMEKFLRRDV